MTHDPPHSLSRPRVALSVSLSRQEALQEVPPACSITCRSNSALAALETDGTVWDEEVLNPRSRVCKRRLAAGSRRCTCL